MVGWPWPVQDLYDNERGDDSLSGESDQLEQITRTVPFKSMKNEKGIFHSS